MHIAKYTYIQCRHSRHSLPQRAKDKRSVGLCKRSKGKLIRVSAGLQHNNSYMVSFVIKRHLQDQPANRDTQNGILCGIYSIVVYR